MGVNKMKDDTAIKISIGAKNGIVSWGKTNMPSLSRAYFSESHRAVSDEKLLT